MYGGCIVAMQNELARDNEVLNETLDQPPLNRPAGTETWTFPRVWAGFLCLLVAITHRLWFVQNDLPAIPMFGWVDGLPKLVGWIPLAMVVLGCVLVLRDRGAKRPWWLVAGGLLFAFLLDQHRLQPWAYQTAIYATVFATMQPSRARRLLIPLAASIYIYSAAGKLDFQFAHTVGQDFLSIMLNPLGLAETFDPAAQVKMAMCLPLVELIAGLLLLPTLTRRYAAFVLIAMHASLLLILGPLGLDHSNGVLIWNIALAVQAFFLFIAKEPVVSPDKPSPESEAKVRRSFGKFVATCAVFLALVAPATERAGLWDHWTSWALYSPHNSRVAIEVHRSAIDTLPVHVRDHLSDDDDGDGWQSLALDDWSLQSLSVPIYPQARYQLALGEKLARQTDLKESAIRCRVREMSSRFSGARKERPLLGIKEIQRALRDYSLVAK